MVDFYCHGLKLVIEVDGSDHEYKYEEDTKRQKELEKIGYKVLRYKNQQVEKFLENVVTDIKRNCDIRKIELNTTKPLPTLPS